MRENNKEKRNTFKRLLGYAKPYSRQLAVALIATLAVTGLELRVPIIFGEIVNKLNRMEPYSGMVRLGIEYGIVLVFMLAFAMAQRWLLQSAGQEIVFNIRKELFAHIHKLSLSFFDNTPVGKLVTRVTNDTEALSELFSNIIVQFIRDVVKIVALAVIMLVLNPRLALRAFILLPFIALLTYFFRKVARACYRLSRSRLTAINTYLSEHLSGMSVIRIFRREEEKNKEFKGKSRELYNAYFREIMVFAVFRPLIYLTSVLALINIIWGGSLLVFENAADPLTGIDVGTLYVFIQYVSSFFEPIQELSEMIGTLQQALASAEKVFTILDEEIKIKNPETPVMPEGGIRGRVEFDHVWFAYSGENWVLRDVSFVIEPGESVAFVGVTGAGKTTILSLVGRYYDVNKGRILVDGVDVRDMDKSALRRAIGQVQQDVFLFTGTIESNISLMNDEISPDEIRAAAKTANADNFIQRLEHGYEEAVMERGSTLSAGQRQLLSFARTLAYDPAILVMDEATANIDTETEQLITEALARLMKGRTTIMVAHRLSTIQHCDCIMVMHKGKIRESGTHAELLRANGIYKKLYELQLHSGHEPYDAGQSDVVTT
ncbi:MAG: ABC transporter ATP-binding protein [Lachnospiraceae bacterium]|nr:ABC transporter ATP-binding protein [Lachnospiraceae bacterium]